MKKKDVVDLCNSDDSDSSSDVKIDEILSTSAPEKMILSNYSANDIFEELDSDEESSSIEDDEDKIKNIVKKLNNIGSHQKQHLQRRRKGSPTTGQPSPKKFKEKKNKNKNKPRGKSNPDASINFIKRTRYTMESFINDKLIQNLPLESMGKTEEMGILKLAKFYNLKCQQQRGGKRRYLVLVKTNFTNIPPKNEVNAFLTSVIKNLFGDIKKNNSTNESPNKAPTTVAQNAAPINEDNVGNKLLRLMGWDGGGLGTDGKGIVAPITVEIKKDRRGLGF